MEKKLNFTIIGSGAGGTTMGAVLSQKGYKVRMFDINKETIAKLNAVDELRAIGCLEAHGKPEVITDDLAVAMEGADVILVPSTTDAHEWIANHIKPYVRDGQMIILFPGHMGGALLVSEILRSGENPPKLIIGETNDLLYPCRVQEVGTILHTGVKEHVGVATVPAADVDKVIETLQPIFPNMEKRSSIMETSMKVGGTLHIVPTLMNVNKMDLGESYDYYMEGVTPNIAKLIIATHEEGSAVLEKLGIPKRDMTAGLVKAYHLPETDDLYTAIQSCKPYIGIKNPKNLQHRFVHEEILATFVPMASLGKELGVETPMIDAFITMCQIFTGIDYRKEGRTVEKLGLKGKTAEEMVAYLKQ